MKQWDVIIIGASAAGLMCGIEAGKRGRSVLILDHAEKIGKKILISGGGRSNFTNYNIEPGAYLSQNPHFCKSALSRYQYYDFLALMEKHKIAWHEKTLGQLFCDDSAKQIVRMLEAECEAAKVTILLQSTITAISKQESFILHTSTGKYTAKSLVIATGGLSIPKMGATSFGYKVAEQFSMKIIPPKAALVPFTFNPQDKKDYAGLSGIALDALVSLNTKHTCISFRENILITHRGLSGPAILQISSYWQPGETLHIKLLPNEDLLPHLIALKTTQPKVRVKNILTTLFPKRLVERVCQRHALVGSLGQYADADLEKVAAYFQDWQFMPGGTEGYRTAEVTLGGVDTNALSSKTMETKKVPGLYFIGEVVDVTGHLGGYNFQWAWSSGYCAGQYV